MSEPQDIPDAMRTRGFLDRWSARKTAAREDPAPEQPASGTALPGTVPPGEVPETALPELYHGDERPLTEEEEQAVAQLPDIDSLHADSDFTPFMEAGVPEFVRRRALRALWRLNPVLANVDGLIDYGDDFTDAATVIEGLQTAYKVGRGFLTDEDLGIEPEEDGPGEDEAGADEEHTEKAVEARSAEAGRDRAGDCGEDDIGEGETE